VVNINAQAGKSMSLPLNLISNYKSFNGVINPENNSTNSTTAFCGEQWI